MPCSLTTDVSYAAHVLRQGGLVAFPTETVYGLGANALDGEAVARIFEAKDRPHFDPLIVHVPDVSWMDRIVTSFPAAAQRLASQFWPGPLTLVLPKSSNVPDIVTAGLPTCGVRVPDHPLALEFLQEAGVPIAAPSANRFGHLSPTRAEHVATQLGDHIDLILDGGPCRIGVESTVLQLTEGPARVLRPGGVTVEQLQDLLGSIALPPTSTIPVDTAQAAPGLLPRHYAPRTPLIVIDHPDRPPSPSPARIGLLTFRSVETQVPYTSIEVLSEDGILVEAAARFFAAMHHLDACHLDLIAALPFPNQGLGRALNDRLHRAARARI